MPGKIRWTLDIEAFVNGFKCIFFRKRLGIDQLIVCTVHFHPMPFYKVQIHKAIVVFRVTGSDLVNTELLLAAIQQHIFLFCHTPLLLQICCCNLEGITSALDFCSVSNDHWPRTDADKINLLTLVILPQSLFTVYYCQLKIRARILVLCIIFPLFQ